MGSSRIRTRQKVFVVATLVLVALTSAGPVSARRSRVAKRVVRQSYTTSQVVEVTPPTPGGLGYSCSGGCLNATFRPNEHHVRIDMRDASGLPVFGFVRTANQGFCGSTVLDERSVGRQFSIEAVAGIEKLTPCGQPLKGTIVATFSG
jgi:hypothetical protein